MIARCNQIARQVGVPLRQSYRFVVKKLSYAKRYAAKAVRFKEAKRVVKKLRTLAGRQLRDLTRQLSAQGSGVFEHFSAQLALMRRVVEQERSDRDKIYSLHEPTVRCIAKGKAHQKYEFGAKTSLAVLPGSNVIVGVKSYADNPHDSKTLSETVSLAQTLTGRCFDRLVVDKGYRGHKIKDKEVIMPGDRKERPPGERKRYKASCRRRCGIEAIISHLKTGHRMGLNYLKGSLGDSINALLSAMGFNLKLLIRELGGKDSFYTPA